MDYEKYYRERLSRGIRKSDTQELACHAQGAGGDPAKRALYKLLFDPDRRVAGNAAWVLSQFASRDNEWLHAKHDELVDEAMRTTDPTKRRLMLVLLLQQPFDEENLRVDFLDFCLSCIISPGESTSVRTLSIKLACEQCRPYPDLLRELEATLGMLDPGLLSTGVRTVRRKALASIGEALQGRSQPPVASGQMGATPFSQA